MLPLLFVRTLTVRLASLDNLAIGIAACFVLRSTPAAGASSSPLPQTEAQTAKRPGRARFGSVKCGSSTALPDAAIVIGRSNPTGRRANGGRISRPMAARPLGRDGRVARARPLVRSEADPHRELRSFPPSAGMQKPKLERWWAIDLWVKVLVASIVRVGLLGKAKFPNSLNSISTWFGFRTSDFRIQISLSAL